MEGPDRSSAPRSIPELLDRLDALLAARPPFFRPGRRAARDAELRRLLGHLREVLSTETREAEAVLRRAQDEARRLIVEAEDHARRALADGTLLRAAEHEGRQLREQADRDAAEMRRDADAYARDVLERLEHEVAHVLSAVRRGTAILAGRTGSPGVAEGADAVDNGKMASV